jgi:predicted RNA binding protein YcfA (HicA-like mRNA interferase family)
MARADKLLASMKANPASDWSIGDVERLCSAYGISCKSPRRGSHYTLSHPEIAGHLTVPARRPIKPVYIRLLIGMVESLSKE